MPLTEEEEKEKEALSLQGFDNWAKKDFNLFLKGQERYGKDNLEAIAAEIEGKTFEEVETYAKVFWSRFKELNDSEKILANIEKAEARLQKIIETNSAIDQKLALYRIPLQQVKFMYGQNKGKTYTEEEDRFLVFLGLIF
jgi:SLIDE